MQLFVGLRLNRISDTMRANPGVSTLARTVEVLAKGKPDTLTSLPVPPAPG